jgi:ferritin
LDVETYVYKNFENLDAELWSFEDFVKNNARKWYHGERHENRNQEDSEVEKRRRAGRGGAAALARYMAAQKKT